MTNRISTARKAPTNTKPPTRAVKKAVLPRKPSNAKSDLDVARSKNSSTGGSPTGVRVRMYRVGFGDFFLVTVPAQSGPKHILIDCGVHSKDTHSIGAAVDHMAQETGKELALIIVTHRHADHVTGFSKCKDVFRGFKVGRIWMSWWENPNDANAVAVQANIVALATELGHSLAFRTDDASEEYRRMVENITDAMPASGGNQNPGAFEMLRSFPDNPPIDYYKAGDPAVLPQELVDAGLQIDILGPPDDRSVIAKTSKKSEEYVASESATGEGPIHPFAPAFQVQRGAYQSAAYDSRELAKIQTRVASVQPDMLAAKATMANNMINNQSLVTLFTFKGKTLLFAGDAQWGNWANFLFGGIDSTTLRPESKEILGKLDFYKVGHHGSTNATPKDALAAMRDGCVAMCSTAIGAYVEVPRPLLIAAINVRTHNQLARSDQVAAGDAAPEKGVARLSGVFAADTVQTDDGKCGYIDYVL